MTPLLPAGPENTGRRAPALAFAVVAVICIGVVAALGFSRGGAAHRVGSGVVVIDTNLGYEGSAAAGTGMVLSPSGEVLTNNHVIKGATTIRIVVPATGRSYAAKVVGYDVSDDVAVLQAQNASNLKTIPLGDSSRLALGQAVTALGNAGGTGSLTKATGTVTGLGKTISASDGSENGETLSGLVETDADVQPGDSGGPLLNEAGEAIGMNTAASTGTPFAAETAPDAYAIPIDKALAIARQIGSGKASATVHIGGTPFLGVELESVGSGYDYGDAYGYGGYGATATSGALIASVVPSGAADSAGLEAGDVITAIDGRSVTSPSTVTSILLTKRPGATLRVDYVDAYGTTHTASVTLGSGPAQ